MQELVRLALLVARALAATQPPRPRVHPFRVAAGLVTVLLCLVTAGGFLLAALWLYLLPYLGPVGTPLVLAGALLIKAGVILLWLRLHLKRHSAANAPSSAAAELAPALAVTINEMVFILILKYITKIVCLLQINASCLCLCRFPLF